MSATRSPDTALVVGCQRRRKSANSGDHPAPFEEAFAAKPSTDVDEWMIGCRAYRRHSRQPSSRLGPVSRSPEPPAFARSKGDVFTIGLPLPEDGSAIFRRYLWAAYLRSIPGAPTPGIPQPPQPNWRASLARPSEPGRHLQSASVEFPPQRC